MRYFKIRVTRPADGFLAVPNFNGQPGFSWVPNDSSLSTYCSLNVGATNVQFGGTNPAAQAVDCDIVAGPAHSPAGDSSPFIRVHGVGLGEIAEASNLNFMNITVDLGMAAGLPLANPNQIGQVVAGQAFSVIGNWEPGDQWIAFYIAPGGSSPSSNQTSGNPSSTSSTPLPSTNYTPANIVFQWQPGQTLLQALVPCLQVAFPKYTITGSVSAGLVRSGAPATGYFNTLQQLAQYVHQMSLSVLRGFAPAPFAQSYAGVFMNLAGNVLTIADGTTPTTPKQIQFLDLVGQPAWTGPYQIQVTCVMRGDIQSGDYIALPPVLGTIGPGSGSQFNAIAGPGGNAGGPYATLKNASAFQGTFLVTVVHAVGASRQAGGLSWVTTFDCISTPSTGAAATSGVDRLPLLASPSTSYTFTLPN